MSFRWRLVLVLLVTLLAWPGHSHAAALAIDPATLAPPLKTMLSLTALAMIPLLLVAVTSFTRFAIVFSMLRMALGLQQTPPNIVLISLSLFLTMFVMKPVGKQIYAVAVVPYQHGELSELGAAKAAVKPLRAFLTSQTEERDMALIVRLGGEKMPQSVDEVALADLIPAFMLSELRTAFKIAFIIFLPFLLVDLVVSSILMSLGMIMLPPTTISMPIKIMLFVLLDGWALISESLINSVLH